MSNELPDKKFTRKQLGVIFKIAFLEAMALSLIMPSVTSSGEVFPASCNKPCLTLIQRGNVTVTVNAGTTAGSTTVTYSPAFTARPSLWLTQTSVSSITKSTSIITTSQLSFLSGVTTQWPIGMPATTTEVFNDANHEHRIQVNLFGASNFRFGVSCTTPSNTLGAYLTIEYSINGGATFTELNSAQRFLIDNSNANCPTGSFFGNTTPSSIPSLAQTTTTILRITGTGGGGVGDTVSFSQLWVEWGLSFTNPLTTDNRGAYRTCSTLAQCISPQDTGLASFIVQVTYTSAPANTNTWTFVWTAGLPA